MFTDIIMWKNASWVYKKRVYIQFRIFYKVFWKCSKNCYCIGKFNKLFRRIWQSTLCRCKWHTEIHVESLFKAERMLLPAIMKKKYLFWPSLRPRASAKDDVTTSPMSCARKFKECYDFLISSDNFTQL